MTFVSYAQNYEDVMLWRVLKGVEQGFYIDIGANDPDIDSVTKAFYERGWSGLNVEPLDVHYQDFLEKRTRDLNLKIAVGENAGEIDLWVPDIRGWATAEPSIVKKHISDGYAGNVHKVEVITLAEIFEKHVSGDVHFLKIDVEGYEASVLKGANFDVDRPWVVVVEATLPATQVENHKEWEGVLLGADYTLAYCDGLNRFYVANERAYLLPAFRYPPNVFDNYVPNFYVQADMRANVAEARASMLESQLGQIINSRAWKISKPLFWLERKLKLLKRRFLAYAKN
ncbi:MAG: FkbM family methyltransferase [Candidatus Zixiibacteriota bacterium]